MTISKRIICILLSLALLLTWPGFTPKAEALAGVDDAALAVGLLFCAWAGVTFATNQGAVNALTNFLNSSANGLKTCAAIAAKNLVNGQLKLTQDLKDAFASFLSEANSTFQTPEGSAEGALAGSTPVGVPFNVPVLSDSASFSDLQYFSSPCSPVVSFLWGTKLISVSLSYDIGGRQFRQIGTGESYYKQDALVSGIAFSDAISYAFYFDSDGYLHTVFYAPNVKLGPYIDSQGLRFTGTISDPSVMLSASDDSIPFTRSDAINGTQAADALAGTNFGDGNDRSIDISALLAIIAAGLAGSTAQTGLSPEELIEILKRGLLIVEIPETSAPTESTDPTKDPDEDTPIAPLPPDQFNFFGDALQKVNTGLERINESVENFKDGILPQIQLFMDSVAQGFIDVGNWFSDLGEKLLDGLKTLGENLSSWLKSLYDASVEFFTKTFPQWVSDFKTWAASLKQTIIDSIKLALTELFVPSANYWDTKITACKEAFPLFNSIVTTGQGLGGFFSGLGTRPPVIYIDLGNSASWAIGGRTIFLDLTWYSKYKPTMDNVLSAFLWLLFAWRFFLKLPGLLRGEGGTIDRLNSYLEHRDK